MSRHQTSRIYIERMTSEHAAKAFNIACDVFVNASVLHTAVGVTLEDYRRYMHTPFNAMQKQGLSLVAIDSRSNEIIGCLVACDYADQATNSIETPPVLRPVNALLCDLETRYRANRQINPGEYMLVDMAAVKPAARGLGLYSELRLAAHRIGQQSGFKRVVGELSSAATQHLCFNRLGHHICAEIHYASFEYSNHKPFASISEPPSIMLAEGKL